MSDLGEELYQKYYNIGFKKGRMQILKNLMKTQNWTALQALKAINTPEEKIPEYLTLLEEKD